MLLKQKKIYKGDKMECPKCGKGRLKKNETFVYCENYKPVKNEAGTWVNEGSCDFRIGLNNKIFGKINIEEVKKLLSDGSILSKDGKKKLVLDLQNPYFTKIEYIKKEDDYL